MYGAVAAAVPPTTHSTLAEAVATILAAFRGTPPPPFLEVHITANDEGRLVSSALLLAEIQAAAALAAPPIGATHCQVALKWCDRHAARFVVTGIW